METVVGSPMRSVFVKKVKLTFPDFLIKQPLLYEMSQVHDIITNIEKANVTESEGWVIVDIKGTGDEMDKALQWMADQGVCVQTMFPGF